MLRKAATVRFFSYTLGTLFTIINLFLITSLLDIFQFAVWGVANSLIFIFSQFGQLTYVQYIEKYFPNFSEKKMEFYFYKFIKTIFSTTFIWLAILFIMQYFGYFIKFNANNLYLLFIIIAFLTSIEAAIEISSKYLLALNQTKKFDTYELLIFKLARLGVFYFLLINGYSVYYLLLANLLIRSIFLISVINYKNDGLLKITKKIFQSKIFNDNFNKLSYTSFAFLIKSLMATFLNLIFIILTIFSDNITIANYSLGILIINNLRPIIASLSSLLTPIISVNIKNKKESINLLNIVVYINTIFIAFITFVSFFITEYEFVIKYFLESFDEEIYSIIFISVFASSLMSIYYPKYINILFSNKEKQIFKYFFINYFFCISFYYFFYEELNFNLIYFYILFEVINTNITRYIYKKTSSSYKSPYVSFSFWFMCTFFISTLVPINVSQLYMSILFAIFLFIDIYKLYSRFSYFDINKNHNYDIDDIS